MNTLKPFNDRLAGLLASLSPSSRKTLAVTVAKCLRASQQQHIKRQQSPDGTPYVPRKTALRNKKRLRNQAMFTKLRTARYMKAKGNSDAAMVEFVGRVQRMAKVHHYGLRDRPSAHSQVVKYDERPLLGFSKGSVLDIENVIIGEIFKEVKN